jgi:hypothetical protein
MSWVKSKRYYQTSHRVGRRVITRYYGRGPLAVMLAREDQEERAKREQTRREARDVEEAERKQGELEAARGAALRRVVTACLEGFGYRRHRREWRRRRMGEMQAQAQAQPDYATVEAQFKAAIAAIHRGSDPVAVEELRRLARKYPVMAGRIVGNDFARLARLWLDQTMTGKAKTDRGGLLARMEVLALELAGEDPSVSRLLVAELAAFGWIETWLLNTCTAHDFDGAGVRNSKRRTAAQGRLLAALRTLERIKALERPRVTQINIAPP